jgi:predicted PurR-regulated permease PerM
MVVFEFDFDWGRVVWMGFGVVLGIVLLYVLHRFVGTFVFGLFLYYSTRRLYRHVRPRVRPASLAAGLSLCLLALPAILLLYYATAIGLQELERFASNSDLQPYLQITGDYFNVSDIASNPETLLSEAGGMELLQTTLSEAMNYVGFIATGLLHVFIMLALAFYLLRDGPRMSRWASEFGDEYGVLETYVRAVDGSLEKIFAGNILNALVTAIVGAISYSVLAFFAPNGFGVPYPALLGLLTGVASLIPIVGMKLVYFPVTGYLAFLAYNEGSGWGYVALFFLVSLVIVDVIPDLLVRPYVAGGDLHTGTVMFAYIFGPLLFGWYGIFLAPLLLVLVTHFVRLVLPELLGGKSIRPAAIDPANAVEPPPEPTGALAKSPRSTDQATGSNTSGSDDQSGTSSGATQDDA